MLLISAVVIRIDCAIGILVIFSAIGFKFQTTLFFKNIDLEVCFIMTPDLLQSEAEWESYNWFYAIVLQIMTTSMRIDHVIVILVIF